MSEMKIKSYCCCYEKIKIQREIINFYRKLHTAYVTAAVYIYIYIYAINNPLLKHFCALDPQLRQ